MHPSSSMLVAFCDAEASVGRGRLIARHLVKCERCRKLLRLIESEKAGFSAGTKLGSKLGSGPGTAPGTAPAGGQPQLAEVLNAMVAWQRGRSGGRQDELKDRLRGLLETYLGTRAVSLVEGREMRAEELLARTNEMLEVFLGPGAAEAVTDDVFRGLDCAGLVGETCR